MPTSLCPQCGTTLDARRCEAGGTATCPRCRATVPLPETPRPTTSEPQAANRPRRPSGPNFALALFGLTCLIAAAVVAYRIRGENQRRAALAQRLDADAAGATRISCRPHPAYALEKAGPRPYGTAYYLAGAGLFFFGLAFARPRVNPKRDVGVNRHTT